MRIVAAVAIVIRERKVRRVDAGGVGRQVRDAVRAAGAVGGALVQLALEGAHEGGEEIKEQALTLQHDVAQVILHEGAENDGPYAFFRRGAIDAPNRLLCLVNTRHEWQSHRPKFETVELREQAVTHRFSGHTRLVGHEENRAAAHGGECFTRHPTEQEERP
jgi:hypothetical protein